MAAPKIPGWQKTLLKGIGAPDTPQNELFVNDWAKAEGGNADNNPFNTTEPGFGATGNYNSVGVKEYGTPQQGIAATLATLKNGRYGGIIDALRQGTNATAAARALAASPWGTGSLVLKMLGSNTAANTPASTGAPHVQAQPTAAPAQTASVSPFIQSLLQTTSQILGTSPLPLPITRAQIGSTPTAPTAVRAPITPTATTSVQPGKLALPIRGTIGNEDPRFLADLTAAAKARGAVAIAATSGERSVAHNQQVGGVGHSNHLPDAKGFGHALDGYAILRDGTRIPLGVFLKPNASSFGLRSGDVPGFYNGGVDTVHVDDGFNGGR